MRRLVYALGIGLSGLLLVLALATVFLPADRIAQLAANQIERSTGRKVTISGDVSMTFWPVLGASVGELEVGNADWSEQGAMVTARNAAIGVDARSLLSGTLRITRIEAESPTIRLESRADGRASWVFTDASGAASVETETPAAAAPSGISIDHLEVRNATLIYDAEGSDLVSFEGVDLALDWPDPQGAAQIVATLRPAGAPVGVSARLERFASLLAGETQDAAISVDIPAGQASFNGTLAIDGSVAGRVSAQLTDTAGFLSALALPAVDLPTGLGRTIDLTTQVRLSPDRRLALTDLTADLGGNTLSGRGQVTLNGVPQIDADVQTGKLDLTGLGSGTGTGGSAGQTAGGGWPKTPIDASALAAFNGEIRLAAQSIETDTLSLGQTRAVLRNDRSRMVFALDEVAAYGGAVTGQFVMNNRSGLSVGGNLTGRGLALDGLLSDMAGITRLSGAADATVEFLGVGASVDQIMRSLRGSGRLAAGSGVIRGLDLDRLMRSGQGAGGTTVFDSLTASFSMLDGVMRNDDLLMSLPNYEARGAGQVNLGAQTLDYTFVPKALRGNDGRGIAIPVRVRGPWAAPRVEPDLEAVVDLNFAEEKERVQNKVREEIGNRLGVEAEEGQSVEDAIEKKLEDEVGNALRRLFD